MSKGRVYLLLGAVLALISGVLVYMTVQSARPKPVQTRPVLVASQAIPPRTFVTAENSKTLFTIAQWPLTIVPGNTLSSPTEALDHVVVGDVEKGAPVFVTNLSDAKTEGQTGLSVDIPADYVAIAVPVTMQNAGGGAVLPGDYVDILVSVLTNDPAAATDPKAASAPDAKKQVSLTTLQHVKVLAVGTNIVPPGAAPSSTKGGSSSSSSSSATPAATMTLLVNHQDALLLKYAKDTGGIIDLALRRFDDKDPSTTQPVDLNYFLTHFGYHLVAPNQPSK